MKSLSCVLPVTINEDLKKSTWRNNPDYLFELRFSIFLKSFLRAFKQEELRRFLIICPPSDKNRVIEILRKTTSDERFSVISETDACPELHEQKVGTKNIRGWYIQQIIKLAVAQNIDTDFYITFDSDIICKNEFCIEDLIPKGKALLNIETPLLYLKTYKARDALIEWRTKRRRLKHSAKLLGYKRKWYYRHRSYGETPVLMHTESVKALISFLEERYQGWVNYLANNSQWTEYSLFFQFLEMNRGLNKFYQKSHHNSVLDLDTSVWQPEDRYRQKRDFSVESILSSKKTGPFIAIQSYLNAEKWLPSKYTDLKDFYLKLEKELLDKKL